MIKLKSPVVAAALFAALLVAFRLILDYLADGSLATSDLVNYLIFGLIAGAPMYFLFKSQLLNTGSS